jgi:hypothetical protein
MNWKLEVYWKLESWGTELDGWNEEIGLESLVALCL